MAPSSSCHDIEVKHGVFISFRGTDVRKGLLSHLKKALRCSRIDYYEDEKLERGDEISPSLLTAIKESQILLVIFSKDYASSKWCLEELAQMIECMEKYKRVLLPVFFNVDPSHVRNQLGEYGNALAKHEETLKENLLKVQSWRSALNKAGHLSGFPYPTKFEDESDLVDKIVKDISKKLRRCGPSESNGLVGIDQNIAQIQSLLLMESSEVRFVGIWGMGGIGKTTIARAIYDKYSVQYDGCCIFNVREELEKQELRLLRERLISELLEEVGLHTSGTSKARYSAVQRLKQKKVFIVLDDMNTSEQLKKLVRKDISFGPGSRVIITSRDMHVLTSGGVKEIHEVKKMNPQDSLKLFCLNAFDECHPKMGYEKLCEEVVKIAQGNPLALEVLGSDFHSRSSIETWTCALNKIKKYPNKKVQRVLRFSYNELHDVEKKAFLDIAFFFDKEDKDYVIRLLDSWGFYGACGIEILQQKALITISYDNRIQMHDLIREMGLEIVRQESPEYPGRRSRLRDSEDVYNVLRNNLGNDKVEAMQIDVTSQFVDLLPLNIDTFKKMPHLRFLKFNCPLHAEICMPPSRVKELLQDVVDSKGRDLNKSNMFVIRGHNFLSRTKNMHDLMRDTTFKRVQNEYPKYVKRHKLLRGDEDVYYELRNNQGPVELETMEIDVTSQITDLLPLNVGILKKLSHLRFLEFNHPLDAELSMLPSHVKALLQDIKDSKRRDLNRSNVSAVLPQFRNWDSAHDLVNSSSIEGSRSKQLMELKNLTKGSNLEKEYISECESLRDADEPILSLEKQVASLLSGCEDLKNIASEIHIKCLHYFAVDGWSGPEEFSVTSKETKQLSITHPLPGMEILNSSIGYLSNVDESDVVHVDDEPFKNMPKDLLCLRCTDYLKLSKSTEQDTQKPKLHILFDGLKVYKGIISFHHDHHVFEDLACIPLRVFSWIDKIVGVPLKISVLSWCREFIVEEHHAKMLREVLPRGPKVRITTFRR